MLVRSCLQLPPNPVADVRVLDVHELRANGIGIDSCETGDHLAQPHRAVVEEEFRGNATIKI